MLKERLFDCCGAYHVYGFRQPDEIYYVTTSHRRREITQLQKLQIYSSEGRVTLPGWGRDECVVNHNPGILTCVLAGYQNMIWSRHLLKLGWVLASNNANNVNSGNDLFFWIKVCRSERGVRPHNYQPPGGQTADGTWTLNGRPYTGAIRWKIDGTPYRVRCPISGELHTPVRTTMASRVSPEVPVTPLPLMRG